MRDFVWPEPVNTATKHKQAVINWPPPFVDRLPKGDLNASWCSFVRFTTMCVLYEESHVTPNGLGLGAPLICHHWTEAVKLNVFICSWLAWGKGKKQLSAYGFLEAFKLSIDWLLMWKLLLGLGLVLDIPPTNGYFMFPVISYSNQD